MADTDQEKAAADAKPAEGAAATVETPVVPADTAPAEASPPVDVAPPVPAGVAAEAKATVEDQAGRLRITQIGSPIGRKAYQRANLIALGLNKMHRSRIVPGTPSMLGRIERVKHLLKVEQL